LFVDGRELAKGAELRADLCIVGAGAAGLSLVGALRGSGLSICLLESGGFEADPATSDLLRGSRSGQAYSPLEATRSRFFGGSTNCWAGFCRPLDAIDFETRDWVPDSGWPFSRSELDPYYERAHRLLGLAGHDLPAGYWTPPDVEPPDFGEAAMREGWFQFGAGPLRMGPLFRDELSADTEVLAVLYANAIHVQLDGAGRRVAWLRARALGRGAFSVVANRYVLATGGIENPRLLLASRDVQPDGVGNQHDLVGRFFMEHPHLRSVARVVTHARSRLAHYERRSAGGQRVLGLLRPDERWLRRTRSLNFDAHLRVARQAELTGWQQQLAVATREIDAWSREPAAAAEAAASYEVITHHEQAPNRESRVRLARESDALGLPRAHLHWQLLPEDRLAASRAYDRLAAAFALAGVGRARVELEQTADGARWPSDMTGGNHHMGTTRMHADPRHGVVDAQGAVHGVGNLFVAGSSLFPTAGAANPTLTIVALALRLADHLGKRP